MPTELEYETDKYGLIEGQGEGIRNRLSFTSLLPSRTHQSCTVFSTTQKTTNYIFMAVKTSNLTSCNLHVMLLVLAWHYYLQCKLHSRQNSPILCSFMYHIIVSGIQMRPIRVVRKATLFWTLVDSKLFNTKQRRQHVHNGSKFHTEKCEYCEARDVEPIIKPW